MTWENYIKAEVVGLIEMEAEISSILTVEVIRDSFYQCIEELAETDCNDATKSALFYAEVSNLLEALEIYIDTDYLQLDEDMIIDEDTLSDEEFLSWGGSDEG